MQNKDNSINIVSISKENVFSTNSMKGKIARFTNWTPLWLSTYKVIYETFHKTILQ